MVNHILDETGKVEAYIVWRLVGTDGIEKGDGEYVFVDELWIHKTAFNKGYIRKFIKIISDKSPTAKHGYWLRRKHGDRMKIFSREQLNK